MTVADEKAGSGGGAGGLAPLLAGVSVPLRVMVGETKVALRELLELAPGTVVELDCNVGDPVELAVGEQVIARGELVSLDGRLGVRVTEILPVEERNER